MAFSLCEDGRFSKARVYHNEHAKMDVGDYVRHAADPFPR
jgi:hypothetical protein